MDFLPALVGALLGGGAGSTLVQIISTRREGGKRRGDAIEALGRAERLRWWSPGTTMAQFLDAIRDLESRAVMNGVPQRITDRYITLACYAAEECFRNAAEALKSNYEDDVYAYPPEEVHAETLKWAAEVRKAVNGWRVFGYPKREKYYDDLEMESYKNARNWVDIENGKWARGAWKSKPSKS